ncbi:MAG: response regulator [Symploca sp. SIO2G7]|nr:response regulator [Symploca sp. SIO2G7]
MSLEQPNKPKILVVDDEPDNLDLLYRTFRRNFQVFRAESGAEALSILATEGEVAVIISDQRMPQMKGTEFLSQTVPQFPDTVRIILTGFTDVEDLVEAINSGQVYKYITKPWEAKHLIEVVQGATETYELLKQRAEAIDLANAQKAVLASILQVAQDADSLVSCLRAIAKPFAESFAADCCILQLVKDNQLVAEQGSYTKLEKKENGLAKDPLVPEVLTSKDLLVWVNASSAQSPDVAEYYQKIGIKMHLLVPVLYRSQVLAILSLQWQEKIRHIPEEQLQLIHLLAQQAGLALTMTKELRIKN